MVELNDCHVKEGNSFKRIETGAVRVQSSHYVTVGFGWCAKSVTGEIVVEEM